MGDSADSTRLERDQVTPKSEILNHVPKGLRVKAHHLISDRESSNPRSSVGVLEPYLQR